MALYVGMRSANAYYITPAVSVAVIGLTLAVFGGIVRAQGAIHHELVATLDPVRADIEGHDTITFAEDAAVPERTHTFWLHSGLHPLTRDAGVILLAI